MGWWRRLSSSGVLHRSTHGGALSHATRAARPPRPPVWAHKPPSQQPSRPTGSMILTTPPRRPASMHSNTAASTPALASSTAATHAPARTPASLASSTAAASPRSRADTPHPASTEVNTGAAHPFTPVPRLVFASGARHGGVGADAAVPPPKSYAYVKSSSSLGAAAAPASTSTAATSSSSSSPSCAVTAARTSGVRVAVEGEAGLVAAAPGAVRRALKQRSHEHEPGSTAGAAAADAFQRLSALGPTAASPSTVPGIGDVPGSTAARTPAERAARRRLQQQTRQARERRRQTRSEEQRGAAVHPCRLQGGCHHNHHHSGSGSGATTETTACAYRHYPSHYCVVQLREGRCLLHTAGCCPWTHGDLGEGVGRSSLTSDMSGGGDGDDVAVLLSASPLLPLEVPGAEAVLRRCGQRVGAVLRLFMDAVLTALEEAPAEVRAAFVGRGGNHAEDACTSDQRWAALAAAMGSSNGDTSAADDVGLRLERLSNSRPAADAAPGDGWLVLSLPADFTWCALDGGAEDGEGDAPSMSTVRPFTAQEPDVWSGFLTVTPASFSSAVPAAAAERVCLTPCTTAWVLEAAASTLAAAGAHPRQKQMSAVPAATSTHDCLRGAALYLLGHRQAALERRLRSGVAGGVAPSLSWAALSMLKDALLCSELYFEDHADQLDGFDLGEDAGVDSLGDTVPKTRCTLLDVFAKVVCAGAASAPTEAAALVRAGAAFTTASYSLDDGDTCGRDSLPVPLMDRGATAAEPTAATSSAAALAARFDDGWTAVHRLVVRLQYGLLCCSRAVPSEQRIAAASSLSLCAFVQPTVLHLVTALCAGFERHYDDDLRRLVGWQPWTDTQLFAREHAAAYTAASYARHHMPVVRLALHNSLLNGLLLVTTQYADAAFALHERSDVRRVLLPAAPALCTTSGGSASATRAAPYSASLKDTVALRQQHLPSSIAVSMGFLTALQEHSRTQLDTREALMGEYEQRRAAHEHSSADAGNSSAHSRSQRGGGYSRVRKYHGSTPQLSADARLAEQRQRLEELHGVSLMDRLLPHGSATVSPAAAASLLRQLLEGGHPYKALKLAASVVHAARMLRHADKQPRPSLQAGHRTVHSRVWSEKRQRHVLVKKRVPVLRLAGDVAAEGDEEARVGLQARRVVRPLGLAFVLDEDVAVEMARVGLRMGEAGAALVTGVVQDCQRGALLDFAQHRGLPLPTSAETAALLVLPLSSPPPSPQRLARADEGVRHWRRGRSGGTSTAKQLADVLGVAGTDGLRRPHGEEGWGAPHTRLAPTSALLEVLQTHTPPAQTAQHTMYLKLLLQDVSRFASQPVLLALQYQACFERGRYATPQLSGVHAAAAAMQAVYVLTLAAAWTAETHTAPPSPSVPGAAAQADRTAVCERVVQALHAEAVAQRAGVLERVRSDASSLSPHRRGATVTATSSSYGGDGGDVRLDTVKALLTGRDPAAGDEGEDADDSGTGQAPRSATSGRQRQAKLSLTVLLHHVWSGTVLTRSGAQQSTALWAVCAATLTGLRESTLRHAHGSANAYADDVVGSAGACALLALHHAYVAAGPLLSLCAPLQSSAHVDATVRALLLSRVWRGEGVGVGEAGRHGGPGSGTDAWPMLFSSATVPSLVHGGLAAFLAVQCVVSADAAAALPSLPGIVSERLAAALDPAPDDVRAWPVWKLFAPLLCNPALVQLWLHDTVRSPSSELLAWITGAIARDDVASYAALRMWLTALHPHASLTPDILHSLTAKAERRHRAAVTRQGRQSSKGGAAPRLH